MNTIYRHCRLFTASVFAAAVISGPAPVCLGQTPGFINTDANHIIRAENLGNFRHDIAALKEGRKEPVRILHIGDSHIQAEFVTNELRRLMQEKYGNAGRGLMVPLRLAGTNQSHDYKIDRSNGQPAPDGIRQTRLLKYPWDAVPGVTGISVISPKNEKYVLKPYSPGHQIVRATVITSDNTDTTSLPAPADSLTVAIPAGTAFYGAIVENGNPGILYSAIGNNGACFTDYCLIPDFGKKTAIFSPDLIILSMGTNEGFSYMTDEEITESVYDLTETLRTHNPDADMLILLPMECQKNRNHGRKPLSEFYDINSRVARARDLIAEAAAERGIPVWDFYEIAGGEGASAKWLDAGLMNKDRIHLIRPGYELQARLLFDAIEKALE